MDSILDGMLFFNRKDLEKEQKEGRSVLPPVDGNWWLKMSERDRGVYIDGIRDLVWLMCDVESQLARSLQQEKTKNLEAVFGDNTHMTSLAVDSEMNRRLLAVLGAGTGGDISGAVTKFYSNKPLLKDKPVLWVLAVPIAKEAQEAQPPEKKLFADTVEVPMQRVGPSTDYQKKKE